MTKNKQKNIENAMNWFEIKSTYLFEWFEKKNNFNEFKISFLFLIQSKLVIESKKEKKRLVKK